MTHRTSFAGIGHWIDEIRGLQGPDSLIILAGNKCDIEDERNISNEEAEERAKEFGIAYYETSAKDGTNIKSMFVRAARELPAAQELSGDQSKLGETIHVIPQSSGVTSRQNSCC